MSDMSELFISLNKNEQMSESLIRSFFDKKQAICSEIKWANSQPCSLATVFTILNNGYWLPGDF